MNTILLKENDLEINAFLDEINVNQSFDEDDTEDDEFRKFLIILQIKIFFLLYCAMNSYF